MHTPSSEPEIGSVISLEILENEKFVVAKVLKGGMGTVYQLVPVRLGTNPAALKTYQPTADRAQFIREAEVWIGLGQHPHIAHALAYTEWQSKPAVFAHWYDNSLAEADLSKWPISDILNLVQGLIGALAYALNSARVVHQDIKPANILLDESNSPHLTDFGMARFAVERLSGTMAIDDVQPTMRRSISLGPIGGTPLYMAPELFIGAAPSAVTDVFSLGVTLYEALTGEHPFLGPETGYRFRPVLRDEPLNSLIQCRGPELRPVVGLIISALNLNPESRPSSYDMLLSISGLEENGTYAQPLDRAADIVAQAAFLRRQDRYQEAGALLRKSLREQPTNPIFLNSYAILLLTVGREVEAWNVWNAAVEALSFTSGKHNHQLYLDPAANLAGRMIRGNKFGQADDLLGTAFGWWEMHSGSVLHLMDYPEFGWWYLYHGKLGESYEHISTMYRFRAPDEASLLWLTLSAWLSGNFEGYAKQLASFYISLKTVGLMTAMIGCVVAASCPKPLGIELNNHCTHGHETQLAEVATDLGITPQTFEWPLDASVCKAIIRSADIKFTGGKYLGIIG